MPGNLFDFGLNPEKAFGELLWLANNSPLGIPENVGRIQGVLPGVIDARDDSYRLYLGKSELALNPRVHETIIDDNKLDFASCISGMVFMSASGVHLAVDESDPSAIPPLETALRNEVDSVFIGTIDARNLTHANLSVVGLMREAAMYTRFALSRFHTRQVLKDALGIYISRASMGFPMHLSQCFEAAEFTKENSRGFMPGLFSITFYAGTEPVAVRQCPATCCDGALHFSIPGEIINTHTHL